MGPHIEYNGEKYDVEKLKIGIDVGVVDGDQTAFTLFRMDEAGVPIELTEIDEKAFLILMGYDSIAKHRGLRCKRGRYLLRKLRRGL